jgi:hypothetical protein
MKAEHLSTEVGQPEMPLQQSAMARHELEMASERDLECPDKSAHRGGDLA